jgi:hypothetical protein
MTLGYCFHSTVNVFIMVDHFVYFGGVCFPHQVEILQ